MTSKGYSDVFVAEYSSLGALVWAEDFGGQYDYAYGTGIALDAGNNIYVTGYFSGSLSYSSTASLTALGNYDAFVAMINSSGAVSWAKGIGGTSGYDYGHGVAENSTTGYIYVTGAFLGTTPYFDTAAHSVSVPGNASYFEGYVAELNTSGTFQWARELGGASPTGNVEGYAVAADSSGNVYTTGYFSGTDNFATAGAIDNLTSVGTSDAFVSKLNSSGLYVWAGDLAGSSGNSDYGTGIALDSSNNIYTTGYFSGTANFNPALSPADNLTSNGGSNVFVSKFSSTYGYLWAKDVGGSSNDYAGGITVDSAGNVYTTGSFQGTANFNPGGTFNLTSAGSYAISSSPSSTPPATSSGPAAWAAQATTRPSGSPWAPTAACTRRAISTAPPTSTRASRPIDLASAGVSDVFVDRLLLQSAPTAVSLSVGSVAEAQAAGTPVGLLTSTDTDSGESYTYALVSGTGSTNNARFQDRRQRVADQRRAQLCDQEQLFPSRPNHGRARALLPAGVDREPGCRGKHLLPQRRCLERRQRRRPARLGRVGPRRRPRPICTSRPTPRSAIPTISSAPSRPPTPRAPTASAAWFRGPITTSSFTRPRATPSPRRTWAAIPRSTAPPMPTA